MKLRLLPTFAVVASLVPLLALANDFAVPERARLLGDRVQVLDSFSLAVGAYDAGNLPLRRFEGTVIRQSWRLNDAIATTLQVLAPMRDQIAAAGYQILFECSDFECGGFDFRFAIDVIPAPNMHVNIRDYRYLAAVRGDDEALSLLVSQRGETTYIQAIHVSPQKAQDQGETPVSGPLNEPSAVSVSPAQPTQLAETLLAQGYVVLRDLVFETGAARLGQGPFASLEQLAEFLKENPSIRIALVGHTDSVGSLNSNISLSKRRAGLVRTRMTSQFGIAPARIEAEGMGYLAPVASNLTREGRDENRRVEVILLSK